MDTIHARCNWQGSCDLRGGEEEEEEWGERGANGEEDELGSNCNLLSPFTFYQSFSEHLE